MAVDGSILCHLTAATGCVEYHIPTLQANKMPWEIFATCSIHASAKGTVSEFLVEAHIQYIHITKQRVKVAGTFLHLSIANIHVCCMDL